MASVRSGALVLVAVLMLGCGGGNSAAGASEPAQLRRIETEAPAAPTPPVTLCIAGALASQAPSDRVSCLITVLDEEDLLLQLDQRDNLHSKVAAKLASLPPAQLNAIQTEIDRLFDPEAMQQSFMAKVTAAYDDAQGRALLEYYATDLGTRYANANAEATSGASEDDSASAWSANNPLSDARKAQLNALWTAVKGPELMSALLVEPALSTIKALGVGTTADVQAAQVAQVNEVLVPMVAAVSEAMVDRLGYVMRDFDDASMTQVIEAERAPHAQWFSGVRLNALRAVYSDAYTGFGRAIVAQQPAAATSNK